MADIHDVKTEPPMTCFLNDSSVEMRISAPVLEDVCKRMIGVILYCLPQTILGTIYKVGPIPELRIVRVASGRRNGATDEILWNRLTHSDYDLPGKVWEDYRDSPGRMLEAMSWCVEKQKNWTADDPEHNIRCSSKQLEGKAWEDYHHMEPVLIDKTDLWDEMPPPHSYPKDIFGQPIWQDSPYATVAVIKVHFLPGCVKRDDRVTRVIRELSQSLGTQMLSLHAREITVEKERKLIEQRQETCNTLAHEFRNLTPKMGFVYRALNNEITYLRESWENLLHENLPEQPEKKQILQNLDEILRTLKAERGYSEVSEDIESLERYQKQLMRSCLLPRINEMWLDERIRPLWSMILSKACMKSTLNGQVDKLLKKLRKSFQVGLDRELRDKIQIIPEDIKNRWVYLAYREMNRNNNGIIQEYINLLEEIDLDLPRKTYSLRNFTYLKALVELIPEIENKLNLRLEALKRTSIR